MTKIRVAIAGLGTVGASVFSILKTRNDFIVTAVSARNKSKDRNLDLTDVAWVDNPTDLANRNDVDVVVEVMGGEGDPALSLIKSALSAGKPVVTANKALMAHHGVELAKLAEQNNVALMYEAAVAGGIPIIKMLREGLAANEIQEVYGILNGTCNYILTKMEQTRQGFDEVLSEAQSLGYAESDPTLDIDGGDTGHKTLILSALAFGCQPDFESLFVSGIRQITADDIQAADELGYRIKLIGQSLKKADGKILQMVSPCLVPKTSPMAHVNDVLNGILTIANYVGQSFVSGRGAGAEPTASAVVADLIDISRGKFLPPFALPADALSSNKNASMSDWYGEFYIRLIVKDRPGVIADIAPILRDAHISIESLIQHGDSIERLVPVMIMTHDTIGKNILSAVKEIAKLDSVMDEPLVMPVLKI